MAIRLFFPIKDHLFSDFEILRYLDEQSFRFNEREDNDAGRFKSVLSSVSGRRLTYKELTGNAPEAKPF